MINADPKLRSALHFSEHADTAFSWKTNSVVWMKPQHIRCYCCCLWLVSLGHLRFVSVQCWGWGQGVWVFLNDIKNYWQKDYLFFLCCSCLGRKSAVFKGFVSFCCFIYWLIIIPCTCQLRYLCYVINPSLWVNLPHSESADVPWLPDKPGHSVVLPCQTAQLHWWQMPAPQ